MVHTGASAELKEQLKQKYKRCKICHSKENLTFHHLIVGVDEINNFFALCDDCHKKVHEGESQKITIAISRGVTAGIKNVLYQKFGQEKIAIFPNNYGQSNNKEEMNIQLLRNKFADLQKEIRKEFQRLEKELKVKPK